MALELLGLSQEPCSERSANLQHSDQGASAAFSSARFCPGTSSAMEGELHWRSAPSVAFIQGWVSFIPRVDGEAARPGEKSVQWGSCCAGSFTVRDPPLLRSAA